MASSSWTPKQNKRFENALALVDLDSPDRWHNLARAVGGNTTTDDVKRQYDALVNDVHKIESGEVPLPNYRKLGNTNKGHNSSSYMDEEQRMRNLKLR